MTNHTTNINHFQKRISRHNMLYIAVLSAMSIVSAAIVWQFIEEEHSSISVGYNLVMILYFISTYILSRVSYDGRRNDLQKEPGADKRLEEFDKAIGIKWLLWATIAFLALVSMFISGQFIFLVYVAGTLVLYVFDYPSKRRLLKEMQLSENEHQKAVP